jgi:hypothetical protein|tara:strand:+ start:2700 stop:2918 length:219 start_codon:yes stop_codon:yes gene_type:complete
MRQACWYEEIYVVQKPTKLGGQKGSDVTLYIDYKGKSKVEGQGLIYAQNSIELEDKIEEAYQYAYKRFILKQ